MTQQRDDSSIDYERLDALMKEKGWKVSDLAHYAKVKYDTVYSIVQRTRSNPAANTLMAICGALNCTMDYLLGTSNNRYPVTDKLPKQVRELARVAGRLSETRQEELLQIAETLEELERRRPVYTMPGSAINELLSLIEELGSAEDTAVIKEMLRSIFARSIQPGLIAFAPPKDNGESLQN